MIQQICPKTKKSVRFADVPKFIHGGNYQCDIGLDYLKNWIATEERAYGIDLDPDFQRGHVWTDKQRSKFVEFLIKGGQSSYTLQWNSPTYQYHETNRDLPETLVLVDGKQRLTACLKFIDGEIPVFGHFIGEYEDRDWMLRAGQVRLRMAVNNLAYRRDLLQWYLELNDGGTIHTKQELDRVKGLLRIEQERIK